MEDGPVREWMDKHVKADLAEDETPGLIQLAGALATKVTGALTHPIATYWTPYAGALALAGGIVTAYCVESSVYWIMMLLYVGLAAQVGLVIRAFGAISSFQSNHQNDAATLLTIFSLFSLPALLIAIAVPLPEQNNYNRARMFEPHLQKLGRTVQTLQKQDRPITLGAMIRHADLPSEKCDGMVKAVDGQPQCQAITTDKDEGKDDLDEVEKRKRDERPVRTLEVGEYELSNASFVEQDGTVIMKVDGLDEGTYRRLTERLSKNDPSVWSGNGFEVDSSIGAFRYTAPQ